MPEGSVLTAIQRWKEIQVFYSSFLFYQKIKEAKGVQERPDNTSYTWEEIGVSNMWVVFFFVIHQW